MRSSDEDAFFGTTRVQMISSNGVNLSAANGTDAHGVPLNPFAAPPPEPMAQGEPAHELKPSAPPPSALSAPAQPPSAPSSMKDILKASSAAAAETTKATAPAAVPVPAPPAPAPAPPEANARAQSARLSSAGGALDGAANRPVSLSHSGAHPAGLPPPPSGRLDIPPGAYVYTGPPLPPNALGRAEWLADETVPNCMRCGEEFNFTLRRHHCRQCGQIYCHRCCNSKALLQPDSGTLREDRVKAHWFFGEKETDPLKPQKVCGKCFDLLLPMQPYLASTVAKAVQASAAALIIDDGR